MRLYIDGRDIRTDLGGIKTPASSTTTTPKKYIEGGKNEITDDMSELVVEIVENITHSEERKTNTIKNILNDVVCEATGEGETKRNIEGVLSEIVKETTKIAQVTEVLNETVDNSSIENEESKEVLNKTDSDISDFVETKHMVSDETNSTIEMDVKESLESTMAVENENKEYDGTQETLEAVANTLNDIIEKAAEGK